MAGDIYTIGRTLMVCATEFRGYQDTYVTTLPDVGSVDLFQRYDCMRRFITKACAPNPDDRFVSADEMRDQLLGVLRQVVAIDAGTTVARTAASSTLFLAPGLGALVPLFDLPELIVDASDPGAAWVGQLSVTDPAERRRLVEEKVADGTPRHLRRAAPGPGPGLLRASPMPPAAHQAAEQVLTIDPWDWRGVWMHGLASLVEGDFPAAMVSFNTVADQIPGESAPRFALGLAAENAGNDAVAAELYASCAASDADYAALGAQRPRPGPQPRRRPRRRPVRAGPRPHDLGQLHGRGRHRRRAARAARRRRRLRSGRGRHRPGGRRPHPHPPRGPGAHRRC